MENGVGLEPDCGSHDKNMEKADESPPSPSIDALVVRPLRSAWAAQLVQAVHEVAFLPSFEAWQGFATPDPALLGSQAIVLAALIVVLWRVNTDAISAIQNLMKSETPALLESRRHCQTHLTLHRPLPAEPVLHGLHVLKPGSSNPARLPDCSPRCRRAR